MRRKDEEYPDENKGCQSNSVMYHLEPNDFQDLHQDVCDHEKVEDCRYYGTWDGSCDYVVYMWFRARVIPCADTDCNYQEYGKSGHV